MHKVKKVGIKSVIEWSVGLSLERMVYLGMSWIIFLIKIEVGRFLFLFMVFYHYNIKNFVLLMLFFLASCVLTLWIVVSML